MKILSSIAAAVLISALSISPGNSAPLWVDMYYPGWIQQTIPPSSLDFSKVTIVDNFALAPNADGTLNTVLNGIDDQAASDLITRAHAAHCKVVITLGGAESGDQFAAAVPSHEKELIDSLLSYVDRLGYDGIDLDIEPIEHRNSNWQLIQDGTPERIAAYQQFVRDLRSRITLSKRSLILTAAVIPDYAPPIFAPIQDQFDQINIMTYNMAGMWSGQTWFDCSLASDPSQPSMPSADKKVTAYFDAGVPKSKLGIGIILDPIVWTGASKPGDPLTGVTMKTITLNELVSKYFNKAYYKWDDAAQSSYLSIPASVSTGSKPLFITYDDMHSAEAKAKYCKQNGLGGMIIWQFGDGYQPGQKDQPVGDILGAIQKETR